MRPGLRPPLALIGTAVANLLATGCQPSPTPRDRLPATTPVGDHLRFYSEPGEAPMCAGSLAYMDRYIHNLIEIHDVSPDLVVDYYWFPNDPERIAEHCASATACTYPDGVTLTPLVPHEHELVHAVRADFGFSQDFIEEGAAEVWGAYDNRSFDYDLSVEAGIEQGEDLRIAYYGVAGRFASFVMYELGTEAFVKIGKSTEFDSSPAEVDRAFESVVGMTASEVAESYELRDWNCGRTLYRDDSVSCASARQLRCDDADADGTLSTTLDLDCASEDFVGPRDGMMWTELLVPVTEAGVVGVTIAVDEAEVEGLGFGELGFISLRRCAVGCEDVGTLLSLVPNIEYPLELSAHDRLFRIEIPISIQPRGEAVITIRGACGR
jgi:hypothetical protein